MSSIKLAQKLWKVDKLSKFVFIFVLYTRGLRLVTNWNSALRRPGSGCLIKLIYFLHLAVIHVEWFGLKQSSACSGVCELHLILESPSVIFRHKRNCAYCIIDSGLQNWKLTDDYANGQPRGGWPSSTYSLHWEL